MEATKAFVERTAGLDNANKDGFAPLNLAAINGKIDVFRYITEIGSDINICDVQSNLSLHFTALSCSVEIIKFLLFKVMPVDLTNTYGHTPLHV